ncbi:uncharacterized protein N7496_004828 [Penicillium cataractarum]|uniref:Fumarylacetoacetase n=1 Tax=Penicillium cataractarum TaxID=2100454 RepID=A0A9W9SHN0_9EURO|nr:uncharacterized protein N7496_004828 [Penicillium cataractarum]KAJ5377419.1 hypothetical protein N7496_004828 [Penicillium cataractarum]
MPNSSSSSFTIENIPFGVISTADHPTPRCATALDHDAIDLSALESDGFFKDPYLNDFASLPIESRRQTRQLLCANLLQLQEDRTKADRYFIPLNRVKNHYPMQTANFSDFYCSLEHAQNCCAILGLPASPNWRIIPSVYNGRTSSLNVETTLTRPHGVIQNEFGHYAFTPTKKLDMELELGVFISKPLEAGQILDIKNVADHIFGFVILNDWSARDIQSFEMAPLGPFHSKGFGTSISPWIVTTDALDAVTSAVMVPQDPAPLPHLLWKGDGGAATFDINLSACLISELHSFKAADPWLINKGNGKSYNLTETNLNELYWTPFQQLTHLASAGEGLTTGDIFGTGTISSARIDEHGEKIGLACLVERSLPHTSLSALKKDGIVWFEDGDEVIMEGVCINKTTGSKFGFGQCRTTITPAVKLAL